MTDKRDDLMEEYKALIRMTEALRAEHLTLQRKPVDLAEHEAHRQRLRDHIEQLHAHIDKWRQRVGFQIPNP
jgi:hypothetical protein